MKKMIFAMTIATGLLAANFANAQTTEKTTTKVHKTTSVKTTDASKATAAKAPEQTAHAANTAPVITKSDAKPHLR